MTQLNTGMMVRTLASMNLPVGTRVLVAVSGGPDSMALLTLLHASAHQTGLQLGVAHVNHQLRPSANDEAAMVQRYAARLDLPVWVGTWPVAAHPQTGVEAAARTFRYRFFAATVAREHFTVLMTAHNQDDQAETVLFRLARTGSVVGVSGIRPDSVRDGLRVVRPLLGVSKVALQTFCTQNDVPNVHDASNDDTRYDRNFLRHTVLPQMASRWPATRVHLGRFATELQGLRELADVTLSHLSGKVRLKYDEFNWEDAQNESTAVQKLLLQHLLRQWYPSVNDRQVTATLTAILTNDGRERMVALSSQLAAVIQWQRVWLRARTPQPPTSVVVTVREQPVPVDGGEVVLTTQVRADDRVIGAADTLTLPITVRHRQPGDRVRLAHGQHQKLGRFLSNAHVPAVVRPRLWVCAYGQDVVRVEGAHPGQLFHDGQTAKIKAQLVFRPDSGGGTNEF